MAEITKGLYLGDTDDALNSRVLWSRNVHCVVNCTNHEKDAFRCARSPWRLDYHRVGVNDDLSARSTARMRALLPAALQKIQRHLSAGHAVLVHCERGRQRSACVVAAYLIRNLGYTRDGAIAAVQAKRPGAFTPFVNFAGAL